MSNQILVATYGSLRRNMSNFRVNESAGGEFVSMGESMEPIALFQYGGGYFPSISLDKEHLTENTQKLVVDIFKTTENGLTGAYDTLEGYPHFYNRTVMPFKVTQDFELNGETVKAGTVVEAWVYHIDNIQSVRVDHGDWCIHKNGENYYETLN